MVLDPNSKIGFILSFKQTMFALTDILRVFPQDSEKVSFFKSTFHVTTAMQKTLFKARYFPLCRDQNVCVRMQREINVIYFCALGYLGAGSSAISAPWMSRQHCTITSCIVYCRMSMQQFHQGGCDGTSIPRTLPYACSPAFATQIILGGGS